MYTSTFRNHEENKVDKFIARQYSEIMEQHDDLNLGLRRIDHHLKRANKRAGIYRNGRRNALYSK